MRIEIDLTEEDILAFQMWALRNMPEYQQRVRRGKAIVIVAAIVVFALIFLLSEATVLECALMALPLIVGIAVYLLSESFLRERIVRQLVKPTIRRIHSQGGTGRATLEFDREGISGVSQMGSGTVRWNALQRCVEVEQYIFLQLNNDTGFIVPREAFPAESDYERFKSELTEFSGHDIEPA